MQIRTSKYLRFIKYQIIMNESQKWQIGILIALMGIIVSLFVLCLGIGKNTAKEKSDTIMPEKVYEKRADCAARQ